MKDRRFYWSIPFIAALVLTACISKPKTSVFQWRMDSAIEHGKSADGMWLGKATAYSKQKIESGKNGAVWRFAHESNGCVFDYITDQEGRGIAYRFVSEESLCVYEGKFSGW